jgi:5-methylcytosine-specific restriction endonuclease McrA
MIEGIKVLVLNSGYEPLHFCAAKRAICMIYTGRAQPVETDGIVIRSFSAQFACPTVIRLKRYIRIPYKRSVPFSKKNVLKRDRHTCQYCGNIYGDLTIDHILPRSLGGESVWLNVVTACKGCNAKKGNRTPEEAGLSLKSRPYKPRYMALLFEPRTVPPSFAEAWKKYLSPALT